MKKYLLFASAAVFSFSAFAQTNSEAKIGIKNLQNEKIDEENSNYVVVKETSIPNEKAATDKLIGTSYNVFTILGDRQNQVVYNPAINTVAFSHRQNDGGVGGSGIMSWDYSTDGGNTWSVNPFQTTPGLNGGASNGNRYPNMSIYNPTGNTNPAMAYMVEVGPGLATGTTSGANGWANTFQASAMFDGTNLTETYMVNSQASNGDDNEWGAAGLYTGTNGVVWYASTNSDNASGVVADNYSEFYIVRGDYNTTNNNFDWTVANTVTQTWNTTLNGTATYGMAGLMNMAWSPNGMVGYMVTMASWGTNTMFRPYVMKTTDGGTTWNNVNDYDFSQNSVLQCAIWGSGGGAGPVRPFFGSYDMVVDANDELRIFAEIGSGFTDHPDSLLFTYASRQSGFLFEVATNGAGWDVNFVDSILVDDFEYDATNTLSHFVRPQASRSQDGSKLFYSWESVDPLLGMTERSLPDVYAVGHDITGNMWTPITNLTTNTAANFVAAYQTVAVDVIENGADKNYELPLVYGTDASGAGITDGLSAPQWHFLTGLGFDNADFTLSTPISPCLPTAVNEITRIDAELAIYPNPATDMITIAVKDVENFSYTIIDIVGNVVTSNSVQGTRTNVDLSNNAKGVYFVKVDNGTSITSKKLVLTK